MKKEWGFAQLLPLNTFKEKSNGLLFDDCCVFGAEIFVIQPTGKSDCLSMVTFAQPRDATFRYKLDNFSKLDQELYYSDPSKAIGGRTWRIRVYPKGFDSAKGDYLSVYLNLLDANLLPPKSKIHVEYKLRVLNQRGHPHAEKSGKTWFTAGGSDGWGFHKFLPLGDLYQESKGFVLLDTLTVEAEIVVISEDKCLN